MNLKAAYAEHLREHKHVRDPAQEAVVDRLAAIQAALESSDGRRPGLLDRLFGRNGATPVKGLYLWGGVGRGKTMLMDLFFRSLSIDGKRRNHFHRIMDEVHGRLAELEHVEDPLDTVADDIARETRVLCFDEFFVSDIGDAMILGRLLEALFERGVCLVATSNSPPSALYKDGLQRQRFLPAIAALEAHTEVVHLGGDTDYRLRLLEAAGTYLLTGDAATPGRLDTLFAEASSSPAQINRVLPIRGRDVVAQRCGKSVVWFDFDTICDGPRSQSDYISIARWYPTVIVSEVPQLTTELDNQARRFIALVDEFYDRRVKLIIAAAVDIDDIYAGKRLVFEFERTRSRLVEMQTTEYLHLPHLA
ncbi:MAG: cell division protein ZapE [Pseudomonadota bacterium]